MYNRKIVDNKEILRVRTVSNTGIYCSSDRVELPKQLEDVPLATPLATRIAMYFQHDRAPSHYTRRDATSQ